MGNPGPVNSGVGAHRDHVQHTGPPGDPAGITPASPALKATRIHTNWGVHPGFPGRPWGGGGGPAAPHREAAPKGPRTAGAGLPQRRPRPDGDGGKGDFKGVRAFRAAASKPASPSVARLWR